MVDVNVNFVLANDTPIQANFGLEPDVTYRADIVVSAATRDHALLYNRDTANQHPITAITGLNDVLDGLSQGISDEETRAKGVEQELTGSVDSNHQAISNHVSNKNNPHEVTKSQVGLGNCDNTSDANKPISTATQTALDKKVSKVSIANRVYGTNSVGGQTTYDIDSFGKVDDVKVGDTSVVTNKVANLGTMAGESTSDYSTTAQASLLYATAAQGALASSAVQPEDLAEVATSGSYADLTDKPTNFVTLNTEQWVTGNKTFSGIFRYPAGKTYVTTGNGGTSLGYWTYDIDGGSNITFQTMTASTRDINFKTNNGGKLKYNSSEVAKKTDINNGTLTIQVNSVDVGEFTANQSTATTVNITVPTDTSDLTNGADYQTGTDVANAIAVETTNRENADIALQGQIDAITASSDVKDIVGTYAELQAYDTTTLGNNDIVKVLQDEHENDETTYYRWVITGGVGAWSLIGSEGPYYTISSANSTFVAKTTEVNGHALSGNITLTAGDVGALPDNTVIPTVNNGQLSVSVNGTSVGTFTANQSGNTAVSITVPTDTGDLTNGAGYITGITSGDVTTALGYTPYDDTNPDGFISGITSGDVTAALGFTPYDDTNPDGYITGITSGDVTTALGYTPADSANLAAVATSGDYADLINTPTVDQVYDGTSANAQSGIAVASAISTKQDSVTALTTTNTYYSGNTLYIG